MEETIIKNGNDNKMVKNKRESEERKKKKRKRRKRRQTKISNKGENIQEVDDEWILEKRKKKQVDAE